MILTTGILLLCINQVLCEDCVLESGSRDLNEERKLRRDLLCNYDPTQSPQNITIVSVYFLLKYFYFNSNEEIFHVYNWLFFEWVDERLRWDPKNYSGLSETLFDDHRIWTPKLKHKNNVALEAFDRILNSSCQVFSPGKVICLLRVLSRSECSTNLNNWPYDIQSCTFKFGAYSDHKSKAVFTFNSTRGISMLGAEYGPGWTIIDLDKGENATSEVQFYLTFVVERQGASLETITIVPSLVLSVLTVSSLFLDIENTRLGVAILSLLGHFSIKTFLNISIPNNGSNMPLILRFIASSLIITTISFVLSFVLSYLRRKVATPQMWVISAKDVVFKTPIKFLIWPRWKARRLKSATAETIEAVETWTDFANVINSGGIVVVIIVYISILISFMPKQMPVDYLTS